MVAFRTPRSKLKIVPRDGELEITLNINISIDGTVVATADNAEVTTVVEEEKDPVDLMIPEFTSGVHLNFGKEEK